MHPGHARDPGQLPDGLGRDRDALGGGPVGRDRAQPAVDVVGHVHAGYLVAHEVQGPPGPDRADAGQDGAPLGQAQVADLPHPPGEGRDVEHELGLHELGAGRDLLAQPFGPEGGRRGERVLHRAEEAFRRRVEPPPGQQDVLIAHGPQGPQQLDAVQVEHRLGPRVVAELRVVAGHDQDVADAEGAGAEQVGLQRDPVAVPAGHLHDRLEPGGQAARLPAQLASRTCEPWLSVTLTASTQSLSSPAAWLDGLGAGPARRADLGRHREAARRQALAQAQRARSGVTGPQLLVAALPVAQPRAGAPAPVVGRAVQQAQVSGPARAGRALVGVDPDTAPVRVHLAGTVRAHSPARPVPQFLGAAHRAHVPGDRQRALAAHAAAEQGLLGLPLRSGERRAGRAAGFDARRQPAVTGSGPQGPLQPVGQPGPQPRMHRNRLMRPGGQRISRPE